MKAQKYVVIILTIFLTIAGISPAFGGYTLEQELILGYIKPSPVIAKAKEGAVIFASNDKTSGRKGFFSERENVEILMDRSSEWFKIRSLDSDKSGWVMAEALEIPPDEPVNDKILSERQLNDYAALVDPESKTDYMVVTDIDRQLVYIFRGGKGNWQYIRSMTCSTGENISPTTRGSFRLSERGEWFFSDRLGSGAKYWVRFNGSYLFHSVAMDKEKNIIDGTLGKKSSNGCIRLSVEDAEWFYKNVPDGSLVLII